nr:MAG TPA: hypothetical protein [Caudoviricetes sp.]
MMSKALICTLSEYPSYVVFFDSNKFIGGVGAAVYETLGYALYELICYSDDGDLFDESGSPVARYEAKKETLTLWQKIDPIREFRCAIEDLSESEISVWEAETLYNSKNVVRRHYED